MSRTPSALLEFKPNLDPAKNKKMRDGLSGVVQIGNTLWVTNDETITLERLTYQGADGNGVHRFADHQQFPLSEYLQLPVPPTSDPENIEEADVEGLYYRDGYLWMIGSHSLRRKKPKEDKSEKDNQKRLEKVISDGNRYLLARVPLVEENGIYTLKRTTEFEGRKLTAARLRGNEDGNDLIEAVRQDKQLKPFLDIPGKDNGIDFEGVVVVGNRLFIGLRGPVLRGWAMIMELELEEEAHDPSTLMMKEIGSDGLPYRKHFLHMGGLGIRDLTIDGEDILILAGPTMDLDGPVRVLRWPKGTQAKEEQMIFEEGLTPVLDVPFGHGCDHAEGMTFFAPDGKGAKSLLVVYDSPSTERKVGTNDIRADIFPL
jgi:hypothetical protein